MRRHQDLSISPPLRLLGVQHATKERTCSDHGAKLRNLLGYGRSPLIQPLSWYVRKYLGGSPDGDRSVRGFVMSTISYLGPV